MKSTRHQYSILFLLIMVACGACGAWVVRQFVSNRNERIKYGEISKLYGIGLGISAYVRVQGCLPDPVIHSSSGVTSSWRVHISQYLDGGDLYKAYDFGQPWDGATNLPLGDVLPQCYQDGNMQRASPTAFTLIPLSKQQTRLHFPSFAPHVTNCCVVVVAIKNSRHPFVWTEPRDISYNDLKRHLVNNPHCFVLLVADNGYYDVLPANE